MNELFRLTAAKPTIGCEIHTVGHGIKIITPASSCDAVRIPINMDVVAPINRAPAVVVQVLVCVESGRAAITCTDSNDEELATAYVEEQSTAEPRMVPIPLFVEDIGNVRHLLVRNARRDGHRSVTIIGSTCAIPPVDALGTGSVALLDAQVCPGARLHVLGETLDIATTPMSWANALEIPVRHTKPTLGEKLPTIIEAKVLARSGRIGFASASSDRTTILDECIIQAKPFGKMTAAKLLIGNLNELGYLLVRNGDLNESSVATLNSIINIFTFDDAAQVLNAAFSACTKLRPIPGWSEYYGSRAIGITEKLRRLAYSELSTATTAPWLNSLAVWLYPRNDISRVVAVSGLYEPGLLLSLKRLLSPGGVFFDIGANVGFLSLFAARIVGQTGVVHAFEPSPREFSRLQRNIDLNGMGNIILTVQCALGNRNEELALHVAEERYSGLNTLGDRYFYSKAQTDDVVNVSVRTLDDYVDEMKLHRLDLIKVDAEGWEARVLEGGAKTLSRYRPTLLIEVVPPLLRASGSSIAELGAALRALGYHFSSLDEGTGEQRPVRTLETSESQTVLAIPTDKIQLGNG